MCFPVCAGGCPEFRGNQYSNPGIATVLHYLAPVFILLFCLAAEKRKPQLTELIVLFLVILGVFLLASHGSIYTLLIPKEAMFFGIASAVFLSVYNLQPKKLLGRFGLLEVIGWGMLTGGLILAAFAYREYEMDKQCLWSWVLWFMERSYPLAVICGVLHI